MRLVHDHSPCLSIYRTTGAFILPCLEVVEPSNLNPKLWVLRVHHPDFGLALSSIHFEVILQQIT